MLGEFISRGLFMILGYAYPAFECFKTVERNKVDNRELRFWCQYWIIVAVLSVCERFGDVLISWLPMYGEMKLAFIIYLWYPKTKGTSYVYDSILRPLVTKHETDIDRQLQELRMRAWDVAIYYYQNCTDLGQSAIFNVIQYVANQSSRFKGGSTENNKKKEGQVSSPPRPPQLQPQPRPRPPSTRSGFWPLRRRKSESPPASPHHPNQRWPPHSEQQTPSSPPMPAMFPTLFKNQAHPTKSNVVQVQLQQSQTRHVNSIHNNS